MDILKTSVFFHCMTYRRRSCHQEEDWAAGGKRRRRSPANTTRRYGESHSCAEWVSCRKCNVPLPRFTVSFGFSRFRSSAFQQFKCLFRYISFFNQLSSHSASSSDEEKCGTFYAVNLFTDIFHRMKSLSINSVPVSDQFLTAHRKLQDV